MGACSDSSADAIVGTAPAPSAAAAASSVKKVTTPPKVVTPPAADGFGFDNDDYGFDDFDDLDAEDLRASGRWKCTRRYQSYCVRIRG